MLGETSARTDDAPFGLDFDVPETVWTLTRSRWPQSMACNRPDDRFLAVWTSEADAEAARRNGRIWPVEVPREFRPCRRTYTELRALARVEGHSQGLIVLDGEGRELGRRWWR
ncbi:MAG: hypothetical protein ACO1SV_00895 [Fimbriimonas sp.]